MTWKSLTVTYWRRHQIFEVRIQFFLIFKNFICRSIYKVKEISNPFDASNYEDIEQSKENDVIVCDEDNNERVDPLNGLNDSFDSQGEDEVSDNHTGTLNILPPIVKESSAVTSLAQKIKSRYSIL